MISWAAQERQRSSDLMSLQVIQWAGTSQLPCWVLFLWYSGLWVISTLWIASHLDYYNSNKAHWLTNQTLMLFLWCNLVDSLSRVNWCLFRNSVSQHWHPQSFRIYVLRLVSKKLSIFLFPPTQYLGLNFSGLHIGWTCPALKHCLLTMEFTREKRQSKQKNNHHIKEVTFADDLLL